MIGTLTKDSQLADFQPTTEVAEFMKKVQQDYSVGDNILKKQWTELNGNSVIDDMSRGRKMFNAFVDEGYETPSEAWKWRGTRSQARNKGIQMHANLTASYLLPTFRAQNLDDEMDKDASEFMSDLVEWMCGDTNSDYKENFLNLVFAMESDPIVYLGAEYAEVMQTIKIMGEDGKQTKKEIMDEVLSGFKAPIYTAEQILVANAHERNIQKHRFNGKRKWIEYEEAKAKYGEFEDFDAVKMGHAVVYNQADGMFYEAQDSAHPTLVEEFTISYRRDDVEVCFIGGVPMLNGAVEDNRVKHRDNFDAPRYNIQQFGFYPIGSHFLFYKSMMNAMRWDNQLYDASTEILANRALLEAEFPVAISGADNVDGDMVYPNAVVALKDKDAKIQKLLPDANLQPLIQSLNLTNDSMSEGSINETMGGQLPAASQKAYSVAQAQAQSKKIIGGVAKGIALSIARYGLLIADIAVNKYSLAQVDEISGDGAKLKYRKFLLENKQVNGKNVSKQLMFDEGLIGRDMTKEEADTYNLKLLEKTGYPSKGNELYVMNPELFARRKYMAVADYKEMFPNSDETMQALLQGLQAQLAQNPYVEQETLTHELMYAFFKGRADKFMKKNPTLPPAVQGQPSPVGQQANQKAMSNAMQNM